MDKQQANAVIKALENGRSFEFSNYHAGTREVLDYDKVEDCFCFITYHAYDPDVQKEKFTVDELATWLQKSFSFEAFDLSED